jgi:hypothetical protein
MTQRTPRARRAEVQQDQLAIDDGISIGEIDIDKLPGSDDFEWPDEGIAVELNEMLCTKIIGPAHNIVWKHGKLITQTRVAILHSRDFHFMDDLYAKIKELLPGLPNDFVIVHGGDPIITVVTDAHSLRLRAFLARSAFPALIILKLNKDVVARLREKNAAHRWPEEFWRRIMPPAQVMPEDNAQPLAGGGLAALRQMRGEMERARTRVIDGAGLAQDGPRPGQQWPLAPPRQNMVIMGPVGEGEEMITVRQEHSEFCRDLSHRLYVFEIDMIPRGYATEYTLRNVKQVDKDFFDACLGDGRPGRQLTEARQFTIADLGRIAGANRLPGHVFRAIQLDMVRQLNEALDRNERPENVRIETRDRGARPGHAGEHSDHDLNDAEAFAAVRGIRP